MNIDINKRMSNIDNYCKCIREFDKNEKEMIKIAKALVGIPLFIILLFPISEFFDNSVSTFMIINSTLMIICSYINIVIDRSYSIKKNENSKEILKIYDVLRYRPLFKKDLIRFKRKKVAMLSTKFVVVGMTIQVLYILLGVVDFNIMNFAYIIVMYIVVPQLMCYV